MKTAELIKAGNTYRAIGGECWVAHVNQTRSENNVNYITPEAWKVEVECRRGDDIFVISNSGGRRMQASADSLYDTREDAMKEARKICEDLDGNVLMGCVKYCYKRPKAPKVEILYRVATLSVSEGLYSVEHRDPVSRRWKPVYGLFKLTRWKANDCVKRLTRGDEIPGYWRVGQEMEFIELADNCE